MAYWAAGERVTSGAARADALVRPRFGGARVEEYAGSNEDVLRLLEGSPHEKRTDGRAASCAGRLS
jgi:hypothetical protein